MTIATNEKHQVKAQFTMGGDKKKSHKVQLELVQAGQARPNTPIKIKQHSAPRETYEKVTGEQNSTYSPLDLKEREV